MENLKNINRSPANLYYVLHDGFPQLIHGDKWRHAGKQDSNGKEGMGGFVGSAPHKIYWTCFAWKGENYG